MRNLHVFESISIDGYYRVPSGDIGWSHGGADDPEFQDFIGGNAQGGGELLMGRVTYEMMAAHWPTAEAKKQMPEVAEGMNAMTKHVVSRSLDKLTWENARLLKGALIPTVRELKAQKGPTITILGSGNVVAQLAKEGLVDRFQFVLVPVVLGTGKTIFEGVPQRDLKLVESRAFKNGRIVMTYTVKP